MFWFFFLSGKSYVSKDALSVVTQSTNRKTNLHQTSALEKKVRETGFLGIPLEHPQEPFQNKSSKNWNKCFASAAVEHRLPQQTRLRIVRLLCCMVFFCDCRHLSPMPGTTLNPAEVICFRSYDYLLFRYPLVLLLRCIPGCATRRFERSMGNLPFLKSVSRKEGSWMGNY